MKKTHRLELPAGRLVLEESWLRSGAKTGLPSRPICRLEFLFCSLGKSFLMQIVRTDILGTLSAGRADGGAYSRGYTNVTRWRLFQKNFVLFESHQVEHAP